MTHDDQDKQETRFKLWSDFNHCWLALLQKQKDLTMAVLGGGQRLAAPQNVLQEPFLERMGRELVQMCDTMERHGLVDYQMGVGRGDYERLVFPHNSAFLVLGFLFPSFPIVRHCGGLSSIPRAGRN